MAPFGVLAFWNGLWMAGQRYPSEYDWRYMTISSLLYPERNPDGYLWAWGGIVLCGLGGLCWVAALLREHLAHLRDPAEAPRPGPVKARQRSWRRWLVLAACLLALLLGGWLRSYARARKS